MNGVLRLWQGVWWLFKHAPLRSIVVRMFLILFLLMGFVVVGSFQFFDYLLMQWLPNGEGWFWQMFSWLVTGLAMMVALLVGGLSFTTLGSIVTAPWLDQLCDETATIAGIVLPPSSSTTFSLVVNSAINTVRPLAMLIVWGVIGMFCLLLPILGPLIATACWLYGGIRYLNFELMDTLATRRNWSFQQREQAMKRAPFFWLGFGGLAMLMLLLPVLNIMVLPAAVVGLTLQEKEQ
ncbi:MAG: EI24 domain-containing protein [Zetaproteobacteria bacterium]|nr:EI24 domain-containing protein [Zetaproteobacteria bacterium]